MIFLVVMAFIFIHMCVIWCLYRYLKNPGVVDVGWCSGLTLTGLLYLFSFPISLRNVLLSTILILWGARLGLYLWFSRIMKGIVDKRYLELSSHWKMAKPLGFFLNFQLQGLLIFIISLSWFYIASTAQELSWLDFIGIGIALIGIAGEALADYQLQQFKKEFPGAVCEQGLWNYSRHPNYFFECLVWGAFALIGLQHPYGVIGLISPLTLYLLMIKITGPMTEDGSIKARGNAYLEYQKHTNMFFPWFKH